MLENYTLRQIKPSVWQIDILFPAPANCWLVKEPDGLTLIDTGTPANAIELIRLIETLQAPLKRIVITHAHPDHAGSAKQISQIKGAQVIAHPDDIPFLQGKPMSELPGFWICRSLLKAGELLNIATPPVIPELSECRENDFIGSLQVLHSPGHTPGSISLWSETEGILFSGDNICTNWQFLHIGNSIFTLDSMRQRQSIEFYTKLPVKLLLPGHGPALEGNISQRIAKLLR